MFIHSAHVTGAVNKMVGKNQTLAQPSWSFPYGRGDRHEPTSSPKDISLQTDECCAGEVGVGVRVDKGSVTQLGRSGRMLLGDDGVSMPGGGNSMCKGPVAGESKDPSSTDGVWIGVGGQL